MKSLRMIQFSNFHSEQFSWHKTSLNTTIYMDLRHYFTLKTRSKREKRLPEMFIATLGQSPPAHFDELMYEANGG